MFQRAYPLCDVLPVVLIVLELPLVNELGKLFKGCRFAFILPCPDLRIAATPSDPAKLERLLPRFGQRHKVRRPEAIIPTASANDRPEQPTSCSGRIDFQVKSSAVGVPSRTCFPHKCSV